MKKNFQSILGPRLKGLRGVVSQSQMASSLGVPQQTYANWELGIRQPKLDDLGALSLQLGVSTDYLLGLSDSPSPPGQGANSATNSPGAAVGPGASVRTVPPPSAPPPWQCRDCATVAALLEAVAALSRQRP